MEKQIKVLTKTLKLRDEQTKDKIHDMAMESYGKPLEEMDNDEKKMFMKRAKKGAALKPCAVQFVMNPKSFTQTVENIFGLSFLVKKGNAEVGVRSYEDCVEANLDTVPGPWVKRIKEDNGLSRQQPKARQAIVSFTMQVRCCEK